MPDAPRVFKTPLVPLVPLLGIAICLFMMAYLPFDTWVRLILWMLVGHDIYVYYGSKHSNLYNKDLRAKGNNLLSYIGLGIAVVLSTFIIIQQTLGGWQEGIGIAVVLLFFAGGHVLLYGVRVVRR